MCSKIGYKSFAQAYSNMQWLNRNKGYNLKTTYLCKDCGEWHLTSMEHSFYVRRIKK